MKKKSGLSDTPVIEKLSDQKDVEYLPTGISELDDLLGGFARGRITEIYGKQSVGKSHLAALMVANLSETHRILYIDAEFSVDKKRLEQLGVELKNVDYIADANLERVGELIISKVGEYDLIVLDSLAVLSPLTIETNQIGENAIGLFARLVKHWVVKLRPILANSETAVVVLNQFRKPIGMYATVEPPGGMAWFHACDVRLELTKTSIKSGSTTTGHWVNVKIVKNKLGPPLKTTKFKIMYGH